MKTFVYLALVGAIAAQNADGTTDVYPAAQNADGTAEAYYGPAANWTEAESEMRNGEAAVAEEAKVIEQDVEAAFPTDDSSAPDDSYNGSIKISWRDSALKKNSQSW